MLPLSLPSILRHILIKSITLSPTPSSVALLSDHFIIGLKIPKSLETLTKDSIKSDIMSCALVTCLLKSLSTTGKDIMLPS